MSESTFRLNSEVLAAMGDGSSSGDATAEETNWRTLRAQIEGFYGEVSTFIPAHPEVRTEVFSTQAADGTEIALHWFTSAEADGAAVIHAHGGGRIAGRVELFAPYLVDYVARSGVSFLSIEYRLAPEAQGTVPTEDVYAGVRWIVDNADRLGVDPRRLAVMGDSAGGGLAAGAALLARDRGLALAGQLLIYPMLDDRVTAADAALAPFAEWVVSAANVGWDALLGDTRGTSEVSAVAAPARAADHAGFPRTYIEVGELDIFRDQSVEFAGALWRAGVSTELHVLPGGTHGYDHWAPDGALAERALAGRLAFLRSL
ncbi:alpha/beta hydrolase [Microbacterium terregens]|uniref:Alpha/beta hydrolase fold domain-containing protein n=1 Tax=Microbacterium terregens TaxID=69363 RepID=A0ABV5T0X3_9MICO